MIKFLLRYRDLILMFSSKFNRQLSKAVATLTLPVLILGLVFHFNSSEWAAWVQAIGSIVAILAAVGLSNEQYQKERLADREKQNQEGREMFTTLRAVFGRVVVSTQLCIDNRSENIGLTTTSLVADMRALQQLIDKIPIFDIPSESVILICHEIQSLIPKTCSLFEREDQGLANGLIGQVADIQNTTDITLEDLLRVSTMAVTACGREIDKRASRRIEAVTN
jgi:hypothetical protein